MKTLNVAVAGYGWAAGAHIDAINATGRAQVTAIYSSREHDAAAISSRHNSPIALHRHYQELLDNPDIDVIDLTSYPSQHKDQAIAAARAGKHLIIEKPLAMSLDDCRAIRDAVREAGVKAMVCLECRFGGQFLTTRKLIDQGLLGELHYGEVDYYHGIGPWYGQFRWNVKRDNGGSSLLSAGCHALDALLLCMGGEVEEVSAMATYSRSEVFAPYEYPTTQVNMLRFKDGRVGKCASVIDCQQPYYFHTHLVGSEGSLLDNKFYTTKLGALKKEWSSLQMAMLDSGDVSDHPYQTQFEAFFDATNEGRDMPLTSLEEAYRSFRVLFACDLAADEKRPVRLDELPD